MKKERLHPLQSELLVLLSKNTDDPLTVREMQEKLEVSSTSVVAHHLAQLEKKGYLKHNPFNPRDYQVLRGGPEKQIAYLNLYGLAHCGPNGSMLDGNPIDRIPISTRLLTFPSSEAFMVKAQGNSMTPKINEGDLVIAKKNPTPDNGSIVVCVNDGEALIKKLQKDEGSGATFLVSLNPVYPPFLASQENFRVEGEVRGIITNKLQ